mmetsp:Transcript_14631/g.22680  ORF Transcript_14631/g.22680 Transcript_14631/m.22680 type:complete len:93 (+) Transcript_14631:4134-4412(+)
MNNSKPDCSSIDCSSRHYQLIFMDLNMPRMDGFESAEKILEFQRTALGQERCVIVALTAFVDPVNVEQCLSIGMKKVINKPANKTEIQDLIK